MMGHSHALVGATTVMVVNSVTHFIQPHIVNGVPMGMALCLGAAIVGALAPDLDSEEESSIKCELGIVGTVFSFILRMFGVTHRGLTHYGIVALLITAVGYLIGARFGYPDVGLAFGLGYISHILIADAMTKHGVPLWGPWPGNFYLLPSPFRFQTGGFVEQLVFVMVAMVFLGLLPQGTPPETMKFLKNIF